MSTDLFSKEFDDSIRRHNEARLLKIYAEYSSLSPIFSRILAYEQNLESFPFELTDKPQALTRNALVSRRCFDSIEEWEKDLQASPFYAAAFAEETNA